MSSLLSIPVVGDPAQALLQVQSRLDGVFGRKRPDLEYVRTDTGTLVEIIVILPTDLPEEDIRALRRALNNIDGRGGVAITVPLGSGGVVADDKASAFDLQLVGDPVGFDTIGSVTVGGGSSTGPNLLHTDGGSGLTLDLSTTPITEGLPILPGSLSISLDIGSAETITDDGAGVLSGTGGSLAGGGTIDYTTGAMTGTTAALTISSEVNETHTDNVALSPSQSAKLDSGAAAGDAALICTVKKAVGHAPAQLSWGFNILFAPDFGLNNNSVSGAKALTLEARLLGAAEGRDIVLRWATLSDDSTPPTAWGTPAFTSTVPGSAPTSALAVDMDAVFHEVVFRLVAANVLGVSYDGTEELFTFAEPLVVPSKILVNHNWSDALDRSLNIDDWEFTYTLAPPAQ